MSSPGERSRLGWAPDRPELVDAAFVFVLVLLGLVGLGSVYGGWVFLAVGAVGALIGLVIAHLVVRLRAPWIYLSLAVLVCYFMLAGAVALRGDGGGPVPDLATLRSLADVALNGWRQLLSVAPPVGSSGPLLALPYLLGMVGSVSAYSLARRTSSPWWPQIPLLALLAASILLGALVPFSLLLQGLAYFAVAALYLSVRSDRRRTVVRRTRRSRLVGSVALLTVAGLGGMALAPVLAQAGEQDRVVLRESIVPPVDPHTWVSPLAELRHWQLPGKSTLGDQVLFTFDRRPPSVVRFATMDAYNGVVYNVAGEPGPPRPGVDSTASGWFQPVGQVFPGSPQSPSTTTYTVTVGAYRGILIPTVGHPTSMSFTGPDEDALASTLRFNSATAGVVAGLGCQINEGCLTSATGSRAGDSYTFTTVEAPSDLADGTGPVGTSVSAERGIASAESMGVSTPPPAAAPKQLPDALTKTAGSATGPYNRALAIATALSGQSLGTGASSPAGHSAGRLSDLLSGDPWVGDAEQFSALMALLLTTGDKETVPARVVVGVRSVPADGKVRGRDVTAWVEVGIEGYGWVPFFPTPAKSNVKTKTKGQTTNPPDPPPPPVSPRLRAMVAHSTGDVTDSSSQNSQEPADGLPTWARVALIAGTVVAVPLVLLGLPILVIVLLKRRRRRYRQSSGPGDARIAAGWDEVVDWARDTGRDVPAHSTRGEIAGALALAEPGLEVAPLAAGADRAVFAPELPTDQQVAAYWADVESARGRLVAPLPRWRRLWAVANPTSLRGPDGRQAR